MPATSAGSHLLRFLRKNAVRAARHRVIADQIINGTLNKPMTFLNKHHDVVAIARVPLALILALSCLPLTTVLAQEPGELADPAPLIEAEREEPADTRIAERIRSIFDQIETLQGVDVVVREGVVILSGSVANDKQAQRALDLAVRLEGVVTVDDGIDRTLDVQSNIMPLIDQFQSNLYRYTRAIPLILVALALFLIIAYAGHMIAKWSSLWRRLAPNPFLEQLLAQAIRVIAVLIGLVTALNLVGATACMGTILGGAGVLGLAIGFAVRDTMEN